VGVQVRQAGPEGGREGIRGPPQAAQECEEEPGRRDRRGIQEGLLLPIPQRDDEEATKQAIEHGGYGGGGGGRRTDTIAADSLRFFSRLEPLGHRLSEGLYYQSFGRALASRQELLTRTRKPLVRAVIGPFLPY
jgi:hypothetical protein